MVLQHSPAMFLVCVLSIPLFQKGDRGGFRSDSISPSARKHGGQVALSFEERDSKILIGRRLFSSSTFIPSPPRFSRPAVFERDEGKARMGSAESVPSEAIARATGRGDMGACALSVRLRLVI